MFPPTHVQLARLFYFHREIGIARALFIKVNDDVYPVPIRALKGQRSGKSVKFTSSLARHFIEIQAGKPRFLQFHARIFAAIPAERALRHHSAKLFLSQNRSMNGSSDGLKINRLNRRLFPRSIFSRKGIMNRPALLEANHIPCGIRRRLTAKGILRRSHQNLAVLRQLKRHASGLCTAYEMVFPHVVSNNKQLVFAFANVSADIHFVHDFPFRIIRILSKSHKRSIEINGATEIRAKLQNRLAVFRKETILKLRKAVLFFILQPNKTHIDTPYNRSFFYGANKHTVQVLQAGNIHRAHQQRPRGQCNCVA